jgi:methylated-DNA-[protein]-cysteine S-methyltransferase
MEAHAMPLHEPMSIAVFPTALGWIALAGARNSVSGISFGHRNAESAVNNLQRQYDIELFEEDWIPSLRKRLIDFAEGKPDDFLNVNVNLPQMTKFAISVVERCRRIAYGSTLSYSALAAEVGSPRAARAVGNVMRANRCPLIIPCHRVVHADGSVGHFSAPEGASMKKRLLAMEQASQPLGQIQPQKTGRSGKKRLQLA